MKTGKEILIKNNDKYHKKYGTVNYKEPKSIYLELSTWAEPLIDGDIDYLSVIKKMTKNIKDEVRLNLSKTSLYNFYDNKIIVDLDLRESGLKFGKKSYLNCEITLMTSSYFKIDDEHVVNFVDSVFENIIKKVFDNSEYFKFYKKKK